MAEDAQTREDWLLDRVNDQGYINVECASSFVQTISYQMERHTLVVNIQGTIYTYYNIPFERFVDFVNSDSKGSYYNYHIKGR